MVRNKRIQLWVQCCFAYQGLREIIYENSKTLLEYIRKRKIVDVNSFHHVNTILNQCDTGIIANHTETSEF